MYIVLIFFCVFLYLSPFYFSFVSFYISFVIEDDDFEKRGRNVTGVAS